MNLCSRCAQLFGDCMPLVGVAPCNVQPKTNSPPRLSAAIAVSERVPGIFDLEPILVTDFYRPTKEKA